MLGAIFVALVWAAGNACLLLDARDIARILGWGVTAGAAGTYKLPGGAGRMCTFDGRDGSVIVTIPSKGTGLPLNDETSDLGTERTPLHDAGGLSRPVELGRDAAIVHAGGHDYAITVQPIDAQFADEAQMRALANALVAHLLDRRPVRG